MGIDIYKFEKKFNFRFFDKYQDVLKKLENYPGNRLFEFADNFLKLTPEGFVLFDEICNLFAKTDQLKVVLVDSVTAPQDADSTKIGATDALRSLIAMHIIEQAVQNKHHAEKVYIEDHPDRSPYPVDSTEYKNMMRALDDRIVLTPAFDEETHTVRIPGITPDQAKKYPDLQQFDGVCGIYDYSVASHPDKNLVDDYTAAKEAAETGRPVQHHRYRLQHLQGRLGRVEISRRGSRRPSPRAPRRTQGTVRPSEQAGKG